MVNLSRYSAPNALGANVVRNRSTLCWPSSASSSTPARCATPASGGSSARIRFRSPTTSDSSPTSAVNTWMRVLERSVISAITRCASVSGARLLVSTMSPAPS
ncbi:Uncharacterised protein [Mycobacteroides abscessus subsp. abscessus]|nr:Uncharacterised protein [Mycobacteroides abscessus subsp. abscessus]